MLAPWLILYFLLPAVEPAGPVNIRVPSATHASHKLLEDGFSVQLLLDAALPAVDVPPGVHVITLQTTPKQTRMEVRYPHRLDKASLQRSPQGFVLRVQDANFAQAFRHTVAVPSPELGAAGQQAETFRRAEALLVRDPNAALEAMEDLAGEFALLPWIQLRRADAIVLQNDTAAGCAAYATLIEENGDRTPALVAYTRRLGLHCAEAPKLKRVPWATLLRPPQIDSPTEHFIAEQVRWALLWIDTVGPLRSVLSYGPEILGTPQYNALLARLIRHGTPLQTLRVLEAMSDALPHAPADVQVDAYLLRCDLELPPQKKIHDKDPAIAAARACRVQFSPSNPGNPDAPAINKQLNDLARRLDSVRAAMRAER